MDIRIPFYPCREADNFIEGTNFKDLYALHMIDTNVNSIVLKNILFIEQYLKTKIAYLVSEQYGVYTDPQDLSNRNPVDYLCRNNYGRSNKGRNNILRQLKETLTSNRINDSVAHYANARNHIPAWILVTNITFGLTIKWYNILSSSDKARICSEFLQTSVLSTDDRRRNLSVFLLTYCAVTETRLLTETEFLTYPVFRFFPRDNYFLFPVTSYRLMSMTEISEKVIYLL